MIYTLSVTATDKQNQTIGIGELEVIFDSTTWPFVEQWYRNSDGVYSYWADYDIRSLSSVNYMDLAIVSLDGASYTQWNVYNGQWAHAIAGYQADIYDQRLATSLEDAIDCKHLCAVMPNQGATSPQSNWKIVGRKKNVKKWVIE